MTSSNSDKSDARRLLSVTLVVLGTLLIILAPQTWPGIVLLALGVLLELIGMSLSHRQRTRLRAHFRNLGDSS